MFPARFHRLSRALDLALELATLGELRLDEPLDTWEEHAAGRPEIPAAAELAPSLPPPFPPATAAGRRIAEARQAEAERLAEELARSQPACAGAREGRFQGRPQRRTRRERAGTVKPPEQPCLWIGA